MSKEFHEKVENFLKKKKGLLICLLVALYTTIFTLISLSLYNSFYYYDFDLAIYSNTLWNTMHGDILHSTILGVNHALEAHMDFILLLLLPLYVIFPNPVTLLFLQSLALGLGALPLFLISKKRIGEFEALAVSFCYLAYPALQYMNLFEFHPTAFITPLLLFSFYFLEENRDRMFLFFSLLTLTCKENVALVVSMLGLYAFLFRKKKLGLFLFLFSLTYFFISLEVIIPYFSGHRYVGFSTYYSHLGNTLFEVIKSAIAHPVDTIKIMFTTQKIKYLVLLLFPTFFLSLFSPEILFIALPTFTQNLLAREGSTLNSIYYQYNAEIIAFVFLSTIFSLHKIAGIKFVRKKLLLRISVFIIVLLSILSNVTSGFILKPHINNLHYFFGEKNETKEKFISMIPKEASVSATFGFLPKLSTRKDVYSFHYYYLYGKLNLSGGNIDSVDYILIDFNDYYLSTIFRSVEGDKRRENLLKDASWGIVALSENIVLLKRNYKSPHKFVDVYKMLLDESDDVGKANLEAGLWLHENTKEEDILYATTVSSYVQLQYVSEISKRYFLNLTTDHSVLKELTVIELPESFGKNDFIETMKKYNVSYVYVFQKNIESEVIILGTDKSTKFSKPKIIASHPDVFQLIFENEFVRIYRINYPKAFKLYLS